MDGCCRKAQLTGTPGTLHRPNHLDLQNTDPGSASGRSDAESASLFLLSATLFLLSAPLSIFCIIWIIVGILCPLPRPE
jgi:hypothetical protein